MMFAGADETPRRRWWMVSRKWLARLTALAGFVLFLVSLLILILKLVALFLININDSYDMVTSFSVVAADGRSYTAPRALIDFFKGREQLVFYGVSHWLVFSVTAMYFAGHSKTGKIKVSQVILVSMRPRGNGTAC